MADQPPCGLLFLQAGPGGYPCSFPPVTDSLRPPGRQAALREHRAASGTEMHSCDSHQAPGLSFLVTPFPADMVVGDEEKAIDKVKAAEEASLGVGGQSRMSGRSAECLTLNVSGQLELSQEQQGPSLCPSLGQRWRWLCRRVASI